MKWFNCAVIQQRISDEFHSFISCFDFVQLSFDGPRREIKIKKKKQNEERILAEKVEKKLNNLERKTQKNIERV